MPFGKHRGELIANIPLDYKQWLLKQPDMDEYLVMAIKSCNT
jgi:exodeoxyribonuclease X